MSRLIVALVALATVVLFVDCAKAGDFTYLQDARGKMHRQLSRKVWIPGHWHNGHWVPGHWAWR